MPPPQLSIVRPTSPLAIYYTPQEAGLYAAYQRHLACARLLATAPYYRDAQASLLFAVECFFKDLYCLARGDLLGTSDVKQMSPFFKHFVNDERFATRGFGHNVHALARAVGSILSGVAQHPDFVALVAMLPRSPSWIGWRYSSPSNLDPYAKPRYIALEMAFSQCLQTCFGALK